MSKILIAEDDNFLGKAYLAKLTKEGYEVIVAKDGNEAMEALDTFEPSIIVLDLIMPNKDGFTVLKEIKEIDKWKDLPIIIASNLGQKEDIDKGLNLGADDYIIKSDLSMSELTEKIQKLIS